MPLAIPNPALTALNPLVGNWDTELVFPTQPPTVMHERTSSGWMDGGALLVMRSEIDGSGPPDSVSVIGRDDAGDAYTMLYVDDRGVSRVYQMGFDGRTWTLERRAPGFSQRFTGTLNEDDTIIAAQWEKSDDGHTWEHDFSMTWTKLG